MKVKEGALGEIDEALYIKAAGMGINLAGGYVRNTDQRVVIGNKMFLGMGLKHRYALRSRIVWWLKTGEFLLGGQWDLHHKNHNRIDDRFENLEKVEHKRHAHEHNPIIRVACLCKTCGDVFGIEPHRLKEAGRGSYCSQVCYHAAPKSAASKKRISKGLRRAYADGRRA